MSKITKPATFESSLAELEEIVSDMEAGQLPLEKSLAAYARRTDTRYLLKPGVRLVRVRVWETSSSWAEYEKSL